MPLENYAHYPNTYIINHPVITDRLSKIRDKATSKSVFQKKLREISLLMAGFISEDLPSHKVEIKTPIKKTEQPILTGGDPVIIPILRAGLGLSAGLEEVFSDAPIGHIGVYRDEETKTPKEYLVRLPKDIEKKIIFLTDPMLATGNSLCYAVEVLLKNKVKIENIISVTLLSAPEGIQKVKEHYPDLKLYTCAIDEKLNDDAFIVPGLGDAGDRLFGT